MNDRYIIPNISDNQCFGAFDHAEESGKIMTALAEEYGINDPDMINTIAEAVKYHDNCGCLLLHHHILTRPTDVSIFLNLYQNPFSWFYIFLQNS